VGLDLRREPIVFTVPPIEPQRYWSIQLIDLYTHNFAYLGSCTTGNGGGSFLIAARPRRPCRRCASGSRSRLRS
jgi:hypothetical protein